MTKELKTLNRKKGSILILALWTLSFLTVFAVYIGMRVRQRAFLISRIEHRSQLHFLAEAGVKKAIAALRTDIRRNKGYTAYGKYYRHNNPDIFRNVVCLGGSFDVSYDYHNGFAEDTVKRFGFQDEEGRVNVNVADRMVLKSLFKDILKEEDEFIDELVQALITWREYGEAELEGFYSEDHYENLEYPYKPKNAELEVIDELLLVQGFNKDIVEKLQPFITIYGDGVININTARREAMIALGMGEVLADKVLVVRRGFDLMENTVDDHLFRRTYDIASDMQKFIKLEDAEIRYLDFLNSRNALKTDSDYYWIQSEAHLPGGKEHLTAFCAYNARENIVEYWREK